ncbi:hypothetical protein RYX45_00465 [Alkalihalophilus pseudofirmus]|uniref:DUF4352 domain-containing protein n=1 Tax=Alkalihalophilus pseudofirmus TaxID=79885 RepID=A0AAJ2KRQ8_ALKPS|nr:hypothetical protein [Alkalihalophilus pseudofirmus]MDV2883632.1 hypothetical protein [Alkalihalophilus pseudofirmus]
MKKTAFIVSAVTAAMLITGCGEEAAIEKVEESTETSAEATSVEGSETEDVEVEEETAEASEVGTRSAPLQIGERVTLDYNDLFYGDVSLEIELLEVISGDEAAELVSQGNPFNDEPGENQEYVLAKFNVKANQVEEEPFDLNHAQFDAVSESGNTYDEFISVSGLEPDLGNELYTGAERTGYTYFLVDKDDQKPLAAFKRRTEAELWFELKPE